MLGGMVVAGPFFVDQNKAALLILLTTISVRHHCQDLAAAPFDVMAHYSPLFSVITKLRS
jgi:hypothetical protein